MRALIRTKRTIVRRLFPPLAEKELRPRLEEWLRTEAPARLGIPADDFGTLERATGGRNVVIFRWTNPHLGVVYARGWRYDVTMLPAAAHATVSRLYAGNGVRVPELLLADSSPATRRRHRIEIAIERAAPGTALAQRGTPDESLVGEIARQLALMHHVGNDVWGWPWQPENPMARPGPYWRDRLVHLRRRMAGAYRTIDGDELFAALERLVPSIETVCAATRPRLVHGDIAPVNLFVDDADHVTWIDFGTVHFGLTATDIVCIRPWMERIGQWPACSQAYRAAGGPAPLDSAIEEYRVAAALFGLEKLRGVFSAESRTRAKPTSETGQRAIQYERRLAEVLGLAVRPAPGPAPDPDPAP
ncbi:MAG: aminoglycoside phosphotransferase family protein [Candidatus Sumerlaeia bacterium]|nr:aminoglycoside phosphotransferase family protein [Candidatus Sumerlaeia bacterium]